MGGEQKRSTRPSPRCGFRSTLHAQGHLASEAQAGHGEGKEKESARERERARESERRREEWGGEQKRSTRPSPRCGFRSTLHAQGHLASEAQAGHGEGSEKERKRGEKG